MTRSTGDAGSRVRCGVLGTPTPRRATTSRRRRLLTAMVAGPTAGGCASLAAPQTRAWLEAWRRGSEGGPAVVELDAVPFHPQTPFHCGPAALATALNHMGIAAQPDDVARTAFLPAREGSLQTEMLAAPRAFGAVATRIPGELRALRLELLAGHPVVVLSNLGLSWRPLWHYAVVVGIDLEQPLVVLRSGAVRRDVIPLATFEITWMRADGWGFVVTEPGRWPASATQPDAEDAALGFERAAAPPAAWRVYESLRARWPLSFIGAMGMGNMLLAMKQHAHAARVFAQVANDHARAAAWNNLAVARARGGDMAGAAAAVRRALELARAVEPALLGAVEDTAARLARGEVP
jgi:hypothetical protein